MLFRTFPPERRARATGLVLLGTSLGPAAGPLLGGVLTTYLSWRWCFFVNVPFGTVILVIGLLFLAEHREPAAGQLDIAGFVLAGGGLALVLYALSQSPVQGWGSPVIIATGAVGLAALAVMTVVELRSKAPMLNLRLLRNRIFRTTSLISLCHNAAYSGYLFIMPEFLQEARGASPLSSGLTTFPGAVGVLLSGQIGARIYPAYRAPAAGGRGTVRDRRRLVADRADGGPGHQHLGHPGADLLQRVHQRVRRHRVSDLVVRHHFLG